MRILIAAAVVSMYTIPASATMVIGMDDFDGAIVGGTRVITTSFAGPFSFFGVASRTNSPAFSDNTLSDPSDIGLFDTSKTDNFLGFSDLQNGSNPNSPMGTVTWTFDISGFSDLNLSVNLWALADAPEGFEDFEDKFALKASIDGSTPVDVFNLAVNNSGSQTYTFADGSMQNNDNPLEADGTVLDNTLQLFTKAIAGTGNELVVELIAEQDSLSEAFALDNLKITGVPEPSAYAFLGLVGIILGLKKGFLKKRKA